MEDKQIKKLVDEWNAKIDAMTQEDMARPCLGDCLRITSSSSNYVSI